MYTKPKIILVMLFLSVFIFNVSKSYATIYFSWDSEDRICESTFPLWTEINGREGHIACGSTPKGTKYVEWQTADNWNQHYTEITNTQGLPMTASMGTTYYLGFFFNFIRINGFDIWHEFADTSADKVFDITGSGIRWTFLVGQLESACFVQNQNHRFTAWIMNATYHLNPDIECVDQFIQNVSGYNKYNPIQLDYEKWHVAVMAIKIATNNTGSATLYINGIKILEYNNIITAANNSPTISYIKMGGTIAQPAYDAPAHYRRFDALILTDNWQDVINGGYLSGGNASPTVMLSANTTSGNAPLSVGFTANANDSDGTIAKYEWDFNGNGVYDSDTGTTSTASYTYNSAGTYNAQVRVTDNGGATATSVVTVTVNTTSGGDNTLSGSEASGGSGCGYLKDTNGKGLKAKGGGVSIILLLLLLFMLKLRKRYKYFAASLNNSEHA